MSHNSVYTVDITVGTPQVRFPILVDTGSSDFVRLLSFGATLDQFSPTDHCAAVDREHLMRNLGMQTIWTSTVES